MSAFDSISSIGAEYTPIGYLSQPIVNGPDPQLAHRKYQLLAPAYDRLVRPAARMRRRSVDLEPLSLGGAYLASGTVAHSDPIAEAA